jgi:hypothetical protein
MSRFSKLKVAGAIFAAGLICQAQPLLACAMCYGARTDSPLAAGMNWGIMSLLAVIVFVLGGVASFFIFLAKKAAAAAAASAQGEKLESTQKA